MPSMSLEKVKMPEQAPDIRNKNFEEVALGYTPEMAVEEAERYLGCKNRPCVAGCPVNVKIPEFIRQIAEGSLRKHTKLYAAPAPCPRCAAVYVRRKHSAKSSAIEGKRANR